MIITDTVKILKQNGDEIENIRGNVQPEIIFIENSKVLIEPKDLIQRTLSNGGVETYEVIDPVFYESTAGISAHYQIRHKKLGIPEAQKTIQNITYNLNGANSRINQNSTDNSTNIINNNSEINNYLNELQKEIFDIDDDNTREEAKEVLEAIKTEVSKSDKPKKTIVRAFVDALPDIGKIAAIGQSIIGSLA